MPGEAQARLDHARKVLTAATAASTSNRASDIGEEGGYPVPQALRGSLPQGLGRGSVTVVKGSTSLLMSLLAEISDRRVWMVLLGMPEVGLAALHQQGIALPQLVLVPDPGLQSATAVAAALDGFEVVVCGPQVSLSDRDRRRLMGKVRQNHRVLLSVTSWPGAGAEITALRSQWYGIDAGDGWLQGSHLTVTCAGRRAVPGQHEQAMEPWARRAG